MNVLGIILLVVFVIIAVFLILLVLIQNEEGGSIGGIFAGGSGSAFGSRSGNVLTKATSFLGALFLILCLGLALLNRSPAVSAGVEQAARELGTSEKPTWFLPPEEGAAIEGTVPVVEEGTAAEASLPLTEEEPAAVVSPPVVEPESLEVPDVLQD
ncbi:preprotein translocase subunit SecG [Breznakiellaceae bacterium SP9]